MLVSGMTELASVQIFF